jgi:hypothetical protein
VFEIVLERQANAVAAFRTAVGLPPAIDTAR